MGRGVGKGEEVKWGREERKRLKPFETHSNGLFKMEKSLHLFSFFFFFFCFANPFFDGGKRFSDDVQCVNFYPKFSVFVVVAERMLQSGWMKVEKVKKWEKKKIKIWKNKN